jgi:hypothetical protein
MGDSCPWGLDVRCTNAAIRHYSAQASKPAVSRPRGCEQSNVAQGEVDPLNNHCLKENFIKIRSFKKDI